MHLQDKKHSDILKIDKFDNYVNQEIQGKTFKNRQCGQLSQQSHQIMKHCSLSLKEKSIT